MNAIMFAGYGFMWRFLEKRDIGVRSQSAARESFFLPDAPRVFMAGAFAGLLQTIVVTPTDLIKCRLQVQEGAHTSPFACGRAAVQANGFFHGLYRGFGITVVRDIPSFVCGGRLTVHDVYKA